MRPKIDVMEKEWKNSNFWGSSKQGLGPNTFYIMHLEVVEFVLI
jgi:hypothetical protein